MTLREVAAIAGKPGLYRIVKPTRTGVIIESLDASRKRDTASAQAKVSLLNEITVYTTTAEGSAPLRDILRLAFEKYPNGNGLTGKSEGADLVAFMAEIAPDFDRDRVYNSDIKKISNWFNTLVEVAPEVFAPEEVTSPEGGDQSEETVAETPKVEEAIIEEVIEASPKKEKAAPKPKAAPKAKKTKTEE